MNLNRIFKSDFLRNTFTLVSGTTVAQLISVVTVPILTRIYLPEDYGVLGIFMMVSSLIAMLATLEYKIAILLPKAEEEANNLLYICLINTLGFSFFSVLLVYLFGEMTAAYLKAPEAASWFYLIPFAVFFSGVVTTFTFWTNRHKRYGRISVSRVVSKVLVVITSITLGIYFNGPMGLIIGYLTGMFVEMTIIAGHSLIKDGHLLTPFSKSIARNMLRQYKKFPFFTLPAQFINHFTNQLPVIILSKLAGTSVVGLFNMSKSMLGLPVITIGSAIGEVFKQRASREYAEKGNCREFYVKTLKSMVKISVIPFVILIIFAPDLFAFAFGDRWRESGVFAQLLGIMFLFKFFVSPLANMYYIAGKQVEDFILHIWMLLSTIGVFYIGHVVFNSTRAMLLLFALNYSIIYVVYLIRSYQFSKGES